MGIDLEPLEIDHFMQESSRAILCISRQGKAPLALPMWFAWIDGKIYIHTLLASKKVGYIRDNPLVSCLVESGEEYFTLKSVLFVGHCEVIDDQEVVRREMERMQKAKPLYDKLRPEKLPPHLERFYEKPRALLRITPHSTTSWDFSKIEV